MEHATLLKALKSRLGATHLVNSLPFLSESCLLSRLPLSQGLLMPATTPPGAHVNRWVTCQYGSHVLHHLLSTFRALPGFNGFLVHPTSNISMVSRLHTKRLPLDLPVGIFWIRWLQSEDSFRIEPSKLLRAMHA